MIAVLTAKPRRRVESMSRSANVVSAALEREIVGRIARAARARRAPTRESRRLAGRGLLLARYVIGLAPLAKADHDAFAALVLPTLQRYLTGELR
jgi:hypothetical protein